MMISGKQLKALASLASKDPNRPMLCSLWLDRAPCGNLRLWVTDGHQLCQMVLEETGEFHVTGLPISFCLDGISRLKAKDVVFLSAIHGLEFNGAPLPTVEDLTPPDINMVIPEAASCDGGGPRSFGIGFGIMARVSKVVCAIGNREQSVRFQCGSDDMSPIRYDFPVYSEDGLQCIRVTGVIMPVRIDKEAIWEKVAA